MRVRETRERRTELQIEGIDRSGRETCRDDDTAIVIETYQPGVECSVPQGR